MKYPVRIICWEHSHANEILFTKKQAEQLPQKIEMGQAVCPDCRNEGHGNKSLHIIDSPTRICGGTIKPYCCSHGHLTAISAFANDSFHVQYGPGPEDFENVPGKLEELQNFIDSGRISCQHTIDGSPCGGQLKPIDETDLTTPQGFNFRTKTRIGDLWDKAGLEPVRSASYDQDGNVSESRTDVANKERLKRMQARNRNIAKERLPAHKVINHITDKRYRRRDRNSIDFNE